MKGTMLIAGGGTGGHLFPGIAVATEVQRLDPGVTPVFVGSGKVLENELLARAGFPAEAIAAKAFRGRGLAGRLASLAGVPGSVLAARRLLAKYRPLMVLAVGGYAAFSLGLAARLGGWPLGVQEQNALPGLTNRVLGKLARRVFISFPGAADHFPAGRSELTGNPVRRQVLDQARETAAQRPDPATRFNVLVLGGSQGARSLNRAVTEALPALARHAGWLAITHQAGAADAEWVEKAYAGSPLEYQAGAFFADMGRLYGQAHLVICRAGAGTITELAACGRTGVLVPYPHAAGDHQTANAREMEAAGAALLATDAQLTPQRVVDLIERFLADPVALTPLERAAAGMARPQAAEDIARRCLEMMREAA